MSHCEDFPDFTLRWTKQEHQPGTHLRLSSLWLRGPHKHVGGHERLGGGHPQLVDGVCEKAHLAPALGPVIAQLAAVPEWRMTGIRDVLSQGNAALTA